LGVVLGTSALIGIFYATWLSGSLSSIARMANQSIQDVINQTASLEGLLTQYYAFLVFMLLVLAFLLPEWKVSRAQATSILVPVVAIVGSILVIWLSLATNLHIIQADIAFKMAEPFANNQQWAVANTIYRRAISLSPDEDYYYLFLGRGSLEAAKMITDSVEQEQAFQTAEADLLAAQQINPLNPDHTANLGRLHSWWALQAPDAAIRQARGVVSDRYYATVINLSPNNARLWDEWAILHLNVLNDPGRALELLQHSLDLDPKYDWTHALLGDYYNQAAQNSTEEELRTQQFEQAIVHYQQAIQLSPESTNYYFALASVYQFMNNIEMVIASLEESLVYAREADIWKIEDNLARFYLQLNDSSSALLHAQRALSTAPTSEQERLQTLISQIQALP
jgi:tetratricopeptide (TPR) repeat protein